MHYRRVSNLFLSFLCKILTDFIDSDSEFLSRFQTVSFANWSKPRRISAGNCFVYSVRTKGEPFSQFKTANDFYWLLWKAICLEAFFKVQNGCCFPLQIVFRYLHWKCFTKILPSERIVLLSLRLKVGTFLGEIACYQSAFLRKLSSGEPHAPFSGPLIARIHSFPW